MTQPLREFAPIALPPLPDRPLISVLIPNYDYAKYIGLAIESVLSQTYGNCEIIVCDDGSTDNSRQVVQQYMKKDSRVKLVTQANRGVTSAVNTAYENCNGDIIALLDADDAFERLKLESVLEAFGENPRSGFCVNRMLYVSEAGRPTGAPPWPEFIDYGWLAPVKIHQGGTSEFPPSSGLSLRRQVAREILPIPPAVTHAQDYYLSHTALFVTEVSFAAHGLSHYRVHEKNRSGLRFERWAGNIEQILPLQKALLTRLYGPDIAEQLRIEDHWRYWYFLLAARALRGRRAGLIRPYTDQEMIAHIPRRAERRLWRAILVLPDPLARRAYHFWLQGPSRLKRMVKAALLPLIRG